MGCCSTKPKVNKRPQRLGSTEVTKHDLDVNDIEIQEVKFRKKNFIKQKKGRADEKYKYLKEIGKGTFGSVYLAEDRETQAIRAIKVIQKGKRGSNVQEVKNEIGLLTQLDHPNIVQIYECYESISSFCIVTEYCAGGELFEFIVRHKQLSESMAARIISQVLSAIAYCHSQGIVHRDLKPENLLLARANDFNSLKVADFGTSIIFSGKAAMKEKLGTAYYIAPEVLKKSYDEKCDLWSCGVILYILLSGFPPFNGRNDEDIMMRVLDGTFSTSNSSWIGISNNAKAFVHSLLTYNPKARPSALEALQNPWLKTAAVARIDERQVESVNDTLKSLTKLHALAKLQQGMRAFIANQLVTDEEKARLTKAFESLDTNGDGRLSREELIAGYSKTMTQEDAAFTVDTIMSRIDADGNGFIEFTEFIAGAMNFQSKQATDMLEHAFKIFDIDGSGKISAAELKQIMGEETDNTALWESLAKYGDLNGDGEIDIEEFVALIQGQPGQSN